MEYSFLNCYLGSLAVAAVFLAVTFLSASLLSLRRSKTKRSLVTIAAPLMLWCISVVMLLFCFTDNYIYPLSVLLEYDSPRYMTVGEITDVRVAPAPPAYYNPDAKAFSAGCFYVIGEVSYYSCNDNWNTGDWVKITWISEERVAIQIENASAVQIEGITPVEDIMDDELTHIPESAEANPSGTMLIQIVVLVFILIVLLQYVLGSRISRFLQNKDRSYTKGIVPNRLGIVYHFAGIILLLVLSAGLILNRKYSFLMVAIPVILIWMRILVLKQTTFLFVFENEILYKELFSVCCIPMEGIKEVKWGASKIPNNRCLRICEQISSPAVLLQT